MRALRLLMGLISGLLGLLLVVIGIVGPAAAVAVGPPGFTVTVAADAEYVVTGGSVTLAGTVKPAAPHQPVEVQQKRDGAWVTVATTSLDPHSRYSVAVTLRDLGDQQLRVTKGGRGAIAPGTSPVVKVNVSSVQLADETVVLTDEDTAHVVSFDLESGRLELDAGADMSDVRVGSILAAGFSAQTPDGMLRRVTSIAPAASGGWVLATEQASISEAVVRTVGDEQITGTLEKQEVVPAKGVTVNGSAKTYGWAASVPLPEVSLSWSDSFDVSTPKPDGGAEGGPGEVGVYGQGSFSVGTEVSLKSGGEMEWDQDWFTVKRIRAAFHSELETKTSTSVTGKVGGLFRKPLAKVHRFYSFPLGPVPVVFEETSEMNFEFDFSYEGGARSPRRRRTRRPSDSTTGTVTASIRSTSTTASTRSRKPTRRALSSWTRRWARRRPSRPTASPESPSGWPAT
ncbi:hypothetical protein [Nocardioides ungokensis]|uniref:hypothetical protein n=1 Tax=Nocardioides ungokensis TaxID=1643322 RepID=UPI0015DEABC7|nr:hypothetical protein [Nocardioides ungokensis]